MRRKKEEERERMMRRDTGGNGAERSPDHRMCSEKNLAKEMVMLINLFLLTHGRPIALFCVPTHSKHRRRAHDSVFADSPCPQIAILPSHAARASVLHMHFPFEASVMDYTITQECITVHRLQHSRQNRVGNAYLSPSAP